MERLLSSFIAKFFGKKFLFKLLLLVLEAFVKSKHCNMDEKSKNDLLSFIDKIEEF